MMMNTHTISSKRKLREHNHQTVRDWGLQSKSKFHLQGPLKHFSSSCWPQHLKGNITRGRFTVSRVLKQTKGQLLSKALSPLWKCCNIISVELSPPGKRETKSNIEKYRVRAVTKKYTPTWIIHKMLFMFRKTWMPKLKHHNNRRMFTSPLLGNHGPLEPAALNHTACVIYQHLRKDMFSHHGGMGDVSEKNCSCWCHWSLAWTEDVDKQMSFLMVWALALL